MRTGRNWSGGPGPRGGPGPGGGAGPDRAAGRGRAGAQIAERAGCTEPTVIKWRRQYAERGLAGPEDAPRPGRPEDGADR